MRIMALKIAFAIPLVLAVCPSFWLGQVILAAPAGSIYELDSSWTNQDGKKVNFSELKGKPRVLAFAYANCKAACPMIVTDMLKIEKALPDALRDKVGFVIVSIDSTTDSPLVLKHFAMHRGLDPKWWTLLKSSDHEVRELTALMGFKYTQTEGPAQGAGKKEFAHSNVIYVIDAEGMVRREQVGLNQEPGESVELLKKLTR